MLLHVLQKDEASGGEQLGDIRMGRRSEGLLGESLGAGAWRDPSWPRDL